MFNLNAVTLLPLPGQIITQPTFPRAQARGYILLPRWGKKTDIDTQLD